MRPEPIGRRLADRPSVATALRDIPKQSEHGANATVVWADSNQFAFMGKEVSHGYADFSPLHEAGFKHREPGRPVCDGDRRRVIVCWRITGLNINSETAHTIC